MKHMIALISRRVGRMLRFVLKYGLFACVLTAVLFAIAVAVPQRPLQLPQPLAHVVFRHVGVVDVREGVTRLDMRVEIADGNILAVEPESDRPLPHAAREIDGSDKFLMPGLWDMHVHHWFDVSAYLHSPLYVANGVVAVRDMGSCANEDAPFMSCAGTKRAWSDAASKGGMIGPRIVSIGSFPIEVAGHANRGIDAYLTPVDPAAARELVSRAGERQWDFIKVYNHLPRATYFALLGEATRKGIEVSGHLPLSITLEEAIQSGQRSVEHATVLPIACSGAARTLRKGPVPAPIELLREALASPDPERCRTLLALMAQRGTWYTPTHVTRLFEAHADDPRFLADPRLRYIAWPWRVVWHLDAKRMQRRLIEADNPELLRQFHRRALALTGEAHRSGVRILAGTDAPDAYAFPGFGLHDELQALVQAGLSPADALRAATLAPAIYTGQEYRYGSIEAGKSADMVLLRADPLADIGNTRAIEEVIIGGRIHDRRDLDRMLSFVEDKASSISVFCRTLWRLLRSQEFRNMFDD